MTTSVFGLAVAGGGMAARTAAVLRVVVLERDAPGGRTREMAPAEAVPEFPVGIAAGRHAAGYLGGLAVHAAPEVAP